MIAKDKIQHFTVCYALTLAVCMAMYFSGANMLHSGMSGAIAAMTAGVTKDADKAHGCIWDWKDILTDSIGIVAGVITFILFALWLHG